MSKKEYSYKIYERHMNNIGTKCGIQK